MATLWGDGMKAKVTMKDGSVYEFLEVINIKYNSNEIIIYCRLSMDNGVYYDYDVTKIELIP